MLQAQTHGYVHVLYSVIMHIEGIAYKKRYFKLSS